MKKWKLRLAAQPIANSTPHTPDMQFAKAAYASGPRLKAISQVLGYLVLENGVFIFGLLLLEAMPLMVEMGVLLDLLVAIFVMGIILNHINREFSSLDTRQLSTLKG